MRLLPLVLALALAPQTCLEGQQEVSQALYVLEIRPGPIVEAMYHEVEHCSGRQGDFQTVKWFITSHPIVAPNGHRSWGWWLVTDEGERQIVLVAGDSSEARHEILHDILWLSGWRPATDTSDVHPPPFGRCAER